jgi:hypothetical protein
MKKLRLIPIIIIIFIQCSNNTPAITTKGKEQNLQKLIKKEDILKALDNIGADSPYEFFPFFEDDHLDLAAVKMNVCSDKERWAIIVELIGFNNGNWCVDDHIYLLGNCINKIERSKHPSNSTVKWIVDPQQVESVSENGFFLKSDVDTIQINQVKVPVEHDLKKYEKKGIEIKKRGNPGGSVDFIALTRYLAETNYELFVAKESELRKFIPADLPKLLELKEWYHEEYNYVHMFGKYDGKAPSAYETFQMIADVIATGDITKYKPTLKPNTHWSNWQ